MNETRHFVSGFLSLGYGRTRKKEKLRLLYRLRPMLWRGLRFRI